MSTILVFIFLTFAGFSDIIVKKDFAKAEVKHIDASFNLPRRLCYQKKQYIH